MYPFNISGVTRRDNSRFALNENTNEDTLRQIIENIPPKTSVMFFDKNHRSPSDPGAYVSFMRVNENYLMNYSNHGWSTKWKITNLDRLQSYLSKCSKIHTMGSKPFVDMWVISNKEPPSPNQIYTGAFQKFLDWLKRQLN